MPEHASPSAKMTSGTAVLNAPAVSASSTRSRDLLLVPSLAGERGVPDVGCVVGGVGLPVGDPLPALVVVGSDAPWEFGVGRGVDGHEPDDDPVLGLGAALAPGSVLADVQADQGGFPVEGAGASRAGGCRRQAVVDDPALRNRSRTAAMAGSSAGSISLMMSPTLRLRAWVVPS